MQPGSGAQSRVAIVFLQVNMNNSSRSVRHLAAQALACPCPKDKVRLALAIPSSGDLDVSGRVEGLVGRPVAPELVHPRKVPTRQVSSEEGRGMLLHALAHIEFNAINLALDLVVNFPGMPEDFYWDWLKVAREEAYHHQLLSDRLNDYGLSYGYYPAHDGLWQMAEKTRPSILARLALVPRLLEARGLDVSPAIRKKLADAGDQASAEILDIILRDEIGHVAIGNRWYNFLCDQQGLDPIAAFEKCLADFNAPSPRSPFNYPAREQAGFSAEEMDWLLMLEAEQTGRQKERSAS